MSLPPLGDLEHEFVSLIWAHGPQTAAALRKRIGRKLADPTVRTVLRRLEEKGYVSHTVEAGTFIYQAKESRESVVTAAVQRIAERFMVDPAQLANIASKLKIRLKPR
jgi:BlaI family penicillinase repressor